MDLDPATPVEALRWVLPHVELVCVMTVNPGYVVQKLIPNTLGNITEVAHLAVSEKLELEIETEGSAGTATITVTTDDWEYTDTYAVEVTAAGNTWTIQTIDDPDPDSTDVGECTSIALDASNHVHIGYWDRENDNLKYATNRTGTRVYEVLGEEGSVDRYSLLAVGLDGESVHISYHYVSGDEDPGVKYARKPSAGAWTTDWVYQIFVGAKFGVIGIVPDASEPINQEGEIHILYQSNQGATASLKHAGGLTGKWVDFPPLPQSIGRAQRPPAMDVRFVGGGEYELHAIYPLTIESTTYGLFYSCYSSSTESWSAQELVATTIGHPSGATVVIRQYDIAVDEHGNVHVCCFDPQNVVQQLFYQFRDATTGDWLVGPEDRIWVDDLDPFQYRIL